MTSLLKVYTHAHRVLVHVLNVVAEERSTGTVHTVVVDYAQRPRRVKKSEGSNTHPWRAREREPIMGVWGRSPQQGSREHSPRWGVKGRSRPEADEIFVSKTVIFNASATVLHEMMYCLSCFFVK